MEGLSEETLKKFLEKGFINQYPDLFRLEEHKDAILEMDGFGEKSYTNLIASVEKAKDVYLANFIYALGINHVGLRNAKLLCKAFDNDLEKSKQQKQKNWLLLKVLGKSLPIVSISISMMNSIWHCWQMLCLICVSVWKKCRILPSHRSTV